MSAGADATSTMVTAELEELVHRHVAPVCGEEVARMVVFLLDDTARRTISRQGDEATIITGDIPAVWLRDSCAQLAPFLRLAEHLEGQPRDVLLEMAAAILRRHWRMILLDPYANAFKVDPATESWDPDDEPTPDPWCWERKFELDSLSFPVAMAARLHRLGDDRAASPLMGRALATIVEVMETETDHDNRSDYWFRRPDTVAQDTLARDGKGTPTAPVGLLWSGFRPSDDACSLHFNIPGNLFAAHALRELAGLATDLAGHECFAGIDAADLARRATALADTVVAAVQEHGVVDAPHGGRVLAYEVDGLGKHLLMDDANNPSLMGLPYLGALPNGWEGLWRETRATLLGPDNPCWFTGRALTGIGSPHTGPGRVWPIALATQALVSGDAAEREQTIRLLVETTNGTGRMHEGIDADDPSRFTREWFSWADAMFCELVLEHSGL